MTEMLELWASSGGLVEVVAAALGELRARKGGGEAGVGATRSSELLPLEVDDSDPGEDPAGDEAILTAALQLD